MDLVTTEPASTLRSSLTWTRLLVAAAMVVVAWVGSGLRSHTWPPTIMVGVVAAAVGTLALQRPAGRPERPVPPRLRRAIVVWAVVLTVGLLWEAYAFLRQPGPTVSSYAYPTLSALLDPLLEARAVRFAAWLVWLGAGLRLLRL